MQTHSEPMPKLVPFMTIAQNLQQDEEGKFRRILLDEIEAEKNETAKLLDAGLAPEASQHAKNRIAALEAAVKIIEITWHTNHAKPLAT